jgi:hypothetical protein
MALSLQTPDVNYFNLNNFLLEGKDLSIVHQEKLIDAKISHELCEFVDLYFVGVCLPLGSILRSEKFQLRLGTRLEISKNFCTPSKLHSRC